MPASVILAPATPRHPSPLRYPGGKAWLIPRAMAWLDSLGIYCHTLVEPFAGGASVGLAAALSKRCGVILDDADEEVYAFWMAMTMPSVAEAVARTCEAFCCTPEAVAEVLASRPMSLAARAFQTLVRNRTAHAGRLAAGAGRIQQGDGRGVASRWYGDTLASRIRAIAALQHGQPVSDGPLRVKAGGFALAVETWGPLAGYVWFLDPPYTAGARLYNVHGITPAEVFAACARIGGPILLTYDDTDEVRALAGVHGFAAERVAMQNAHARRQHELVLTRPARTECLWLNPRAAAARPTLFD